GSTDGSAELISSKYTWIKLIKNQKNEGFAKPSNDGARRATGEYVAFLNNDMKVERDWLIELVKSMESNNASCAGSVIMNWNGELLDFAGGSISFYGMGYQYHFHESMDKVESLLTQDKELLFSCGGAMIVKRDLFLRIGGFDEDYFAFFEDIDLGWRLNVLGEKVVLSVKSRAYHKHHSTGNRFSKERMQVLYERNSLYTIYKNYGEELLNKAFWPAILMNNANAFGRSGIDRDEFDLRISSKKFDDKGTFISNLAAAQLCALHDFVKNLNKMTEKRRYIQANRKISDEKIIRYINDPFICLGKDLNQFNLIKYDFAKNFGIDKAFNMDLKRRVLLVSSDTIGKKMAGPAIRYYEFAKSLSKSCDVVLASCGTCDIESDQFKIIDYSYEHSENLTFEAMQSDIIVTQGFTLEFCKQFEYISKSRYLIIDLYDPYVIENIEVFKDHEIKRRREDFEFSSSAIINQLKSGDFFVAANSKQKDYWLGMLSSLKRVSPEVYDISHNYNRLIDVVPFGISDTAPAHKKNVLKGVWPGISKDDHVLIWGGGVWNWFDPITLIKGMAVIAQKRSDIKLFFLGVKHPNPNIPEMKMLNDAVELAKETGLYNKSVFFNFDWVDYDDRQNYLLEADIGVSCHFDTIETRFSFRTRILDYLWAGLPIISTKGDYFSDLVEKEKLGITVDFKDEQQIADAVIRLIDDREFYEQCKKQISRVAEGYKWSKITKPIVDFCSDPIHLSGTTKDQTEEEDSENENTEDKSSKSPMRKGSIYQMLYSIAQRQGAIEKQLRRNTMINEKIYHKTSEIQEWSYMMNGRFNKIKKYANPFKLIARLFRRRK
ncbi:MAG TPA: glycosyltransferase, partial [Clostridia bacterium]|nr:glycosyltransferase [Clostridia bacterium]